VQIADRAFVVTGASSGLGREIARQLADRGGRVALVARRADRLGELAAQIGPNAVAVPVDVTTAEAPDRIHAATLEAFGRVDGLVNAAGRGFAGDVATLDVDLLDETFELNFVAPIRLIQRIVPTLLEQEEGVVVNVSSPTSLMGLPGIGGYASAKAALNAATVALRREVAAKGVQVMLVFPGVMDTEYYDRIMGDVDPNEARPPARPPGEVARAVVEGIVRHRREVWSLSSRERRALSIMRLLGRIAPATLDRGLSRR
jgi:short-subunit dehydrogenase